MTKGKRNYLLQKLSPICYNIWAFRDPSKLSGYLGKKPKQPKTTAVKGKYKSAKERHQ